MYAHPPDALFAQNFTAQAAFYSFQCCFLAETILACLLLLVSFLHLCASAPHCCHMYSIMQIQVCLVAAVQPHDSIPPLQSNTVPPSLSYVTAMYRHVGQLACTASSSHITFMGC